MSDVVRLLDELRATHGEVHLARCQVDVAFPVGLKTGSQPHCPWYREFAGMPQIIEVTDTGWETYHFASLWDAEQFAQDTRRRVALGEFAGGRLPTGAEVTIQQRATIEVRHDDVVAAAASVHVQQNG